jgi:hypothetical protein
MKRYMLLLLIIALPISIHAAEGGLSNYVPAFYGDLGLAVEPPFTIVKGSPVRMSTLSPSGCMTIMRKNVSKATLPMFHWH